MDIILLAVRITKCGPPSSFTVILRHHQDEMPGLSCCEDLNLLLKGSLGVLQRAVFLEAGGSCLPLGIKLSIFSLFYYLFALVLGDFGLTSFPFFFLSSPGC